MLWLFVGENEIIDESIYPFENYVNNYVIVDLTMTSDRVIRIFCETQIMKAFPFTVSRYIIFLFYFILY